MSSANLVGVSHVRPQLTLSEKFRLLALVIFLLFTKVIPSFILDVCKRRDFSTPTLQRTLVKQIGRCGPSLPVRMSQSLQTPTGETIKHRCKQVNIKHESEQLFVGNFPQATLHFVGCGSSQRGNILLYFHGGGYVFPMTNGHFAFAQLAAKAAHADLAILEYGLAPALKYPGQLAQAAAAVRFLLQEHHPSQILIGGDSGGGNLALALLSHLRSPHPSVQTLSGPDGQPPVLRGMFCISPRCANDYNSPSFTSNASKDIIGVESMKLFTSNWQPAADQVWATPIQGDRHFWSSIAAQRLLLVAGEDEVYRDDIAHLAELMGAESRSGAERQFTVCPGEIHVQCVLDMGIGIDTSYMLTAVLQWLKSLP